jgi:hypothetical protein
MGVMGSIFITVLDGAGSSFTGTIDTRYPAGADTYNRTATGNDSYNRTTTAGDELTQSISGRGPN